MYKELLDGHDLICKCIGHWCWFKVLKVAAEDHLTMDPILHLYQMHLKASTPKLKEILFCVEYLFFMNIVSDI